MAVPGQNRMLLGMERLHKMLLYPILGIIALSLGLMACVFGMDNVLFDGQDNGDVYYQNYSISLLGDSEKSKTIKYGFELFQHTPKYLGPDSKNPYAGNHLSCNNCHLLSGTKPYAAPLIGITKRFPQFRNRENKMGSLEERINGCMQRSMNGTALPEDSNEMKAFVAYLEWLGRYAPSDGKIEGQGFVSIQIPNRPVNLENGKNIFAKQCAECHGNDGQGKLALDGQIYQYPPLWGEDSYNNGAGMTRVITAASFIKGNMPYGTTYRNPILTDAEAYDVAGFINQQERPKKKNLEEDFPDLKKKPVSTPYGPYVDSFSLVQHQLGPFQPIMEYYKKEFNLIKNK
jgi:thiosulfate dehydrogenase